MTLWSGRFDAAPDAETLEFGASFAFDRRLFEDDVTGSLAWARALGRAGVLAPDETRAIEVALGEIRERAHADTQSVDGPDEDVHSFVERLLVERVVVHVRADSEQTEVDMVWRGGLRTSHAIVRSVSRYESLSDYPQLLARIGHLRQDGLTIAQVATQLNKEGYRTPRSRKGYTSTSVRKLLSRQRQKGER